MLPANELAVLQDVSASALPDTCTVQRNASLGTPDSNGTTPENWQNVAGLVGIACMRNTPNAGIQQTLASQLGLVQAWTISLPTNDTNGNPVVVQQKDRVLYQDGLTYTMQALLPQSYSTLTQFLASRLGVK